MRYSHPLVLGTLTLCAVACGGQVASHSSGAQGQSSAGDSNGDPSSSASTGPSAPTPGAPSADVTPDAPAAQSPTPADAPCSVAPGAATRIYTGHPEAFAIDGSFVYAAEYTGMSRVPLAGGPAEAITAPVDLRGAVSSFVLAAGNVYFDPDLTGMLTKVPVHGDAFHGPTYTARSSPYAGMAFDGLSLYSGQLEGQPPVIRRWSLDGTVQAEHPLPTGTYVQAIVAGPDAAYAALLTVSNGGSTSTGAIALVPKETGDLVILKDDVGEPSAIGVDGDYLYYAATRGGLATGGLYRMSLNDHTITTLSEPSPMSFAVDAHSIFFLRNSLIYKMDKAGGTPTKVGAAQQFGGVLVNGGNVFWSAAVDGESVPAGVWTACK